MKKDKWINKQVNRLSLLLLLGLIVVLSTCKKNDADILDDEASDFLTEEEAILIENLDDFPHFDLSSAILPNGESVENFFLMYDSLLNNFQKTELHPYNYFDEWAQEYWIRSRLYVEALYLTDRTKHQYSYEGSDMPQQNGLAYGWGNKNHRFRRSPKHSKSICTHKIYGLDCSGLITQLFYSANVRLKKLDYSANEIRKGTVITKALGEGWPDLEGWYFEDMGQIDLSLIQSGDIVYFIPKGKVNASHIGMAFSYKEKNSNASRLVVFQSNGYPVVNLPNRCIENLQLKSGPRIIELTNEGWFGPNVYKYGITRLISPLTLVKTRPIYTKENKLEKIDGLSIISGGEILRQGNSPIISKGVCWSTQLPPSIDDNKTDEGQGDASYASTITGLESNTTYYIRAYAKNNEGVSYGDLLTYKTAPPGGTTGQPCPESPTITDIDGNIYNTVLIGNQCWMKENLKTTKYRNNSPIEYPGSNSNAWESNIAGAYAWYDNDISWKNLYGALYNWHAVNNTNGLCPTGWHVPSDAEWTQLVDYAVAQGFPNNNVTNGSANALKSCRQVNSPLGGDCNTTVHPRWDYFETRHGFDIFGFSAFPGGRHFVNGSFGSLGTYVYWWSSTASSSTSGAYMREIHHTSGDLPSPDTPHKANGFSVRCLRD